MPFTKYAKKLENLRQLIHNLLRIK